MNRFLLTATSIACFASHTHAQFIPNVFDRNSGANTYYANSIGEKLDDTNWMSTFAGLSANAGANFLASANGNADHDFLDIGFSKNLGGTIENHAYHLSFYIASYTDNPALNIQPVNFADFSSLRIGGASGTVLWDSTPTPSIYNQWYKWTGVYTPAPSDLGNPFYFTAVFDLDSRHSIAIDGPITDSFVPEPATWLGMAIVFYGSLAVPRRRSAGYSANS